ncbi:MAG TPA: DUF4375 domain-containing protein [Saprospiraceae bacterium]|nr:DUF4375 domain-containing protein [Saprospiraceae bacterium]
MKYFNSIFIFLILIIVSCQSSNNKERINYWNKFDKEDHFLPEMKKSLFDSLHGSDLTYAILDLIDVAKDGKDEIELSKRLSSGQKAIYFYTFLEDEVENGGFLQFYLNEYDKYVPAIYDALNLIGDTKTISLLKESENEYKKNISLFELYKHKTDWTEIYKQMKVMEKLDNVFYKDDEHVETHKLFEKYIRTHVNEIVKLI